MAKTSVPKFEPSKIEKKWQRAWSRSKIFRGKSGQGKKSYVLEMFPYPSGRIHMGHVRNYCVGDVIARYRLHKGYNVLHPMGFDAFGLPAENAAIQNKVPPRKWTYNNIRFMKRQLQRLGFSIDWSREVVTCDPGYYRWEQELFLDMYAKGLAYRKRSMVHWCPRCQTVLANEQVEGGKCWRCDAKVDNRSLDQWFLKITAYAEELLGGLRELETGWPEKVLTMQRNWIGRSEGAHIEFPIENRENMNIRVFTTRPDTLFGVTFLSIAPEHPYVEEILRQSDPERRKKLEQFSEKVRVLDPSQRVGEGLTKEGMETGIFCLHPFTRTRVPVFLANYVVMDYGTGAVMGVPCHDQRDFEFAKLYGLPTKLVIEPLNHQLTEEDMEEAYEGPGTMVNSGDFDDKDNVSAGNEIVRALQLKNLGESTITYRLRDWGISRQRYWGTPIPMIHCDACGIVPVPKKDLPVKLPGNVPITGTGGSALAKVPSFLKVKCPQCGKPARRETDTMDTFMESSWYFFRYCSPNFRKGMFDKNEAEYWMPVDQYIGGIEHAILHLLYARFITRVLRDFGYTSLSEPFSRLLTQGMVIKDGEKMSKSRGNVVDPDDLIAKYGADTVRLFSLFAAPVERDLDWSDQGVEGSARFLDRLWRFTLNIQKLPNPKKSSVESSSPAEETARSILRATHQTIKSVTDSLERFHFNTAISALMELINFVANKVPEVWEFAASPEKGVTLSRETMEALRFSAETSLRLLCPFAPHISEELWNRTHHKKDLLSASPWPTFDPKLAREERVTVVVQVNGKVRARVQAERGAEESAVVAMAQADANVRRHTEGKLIQKTIFVPDKLVNLVLG